MNRTRTLLIITICFLGLWAYKLNIKPLKEVHELPPKQLDVSPDNNTSDLSIDLSVSADAVSSRTAEKEKKARLKTKEDGPDVIPKEYILSFKNNQDKFKFIATAKSKGITILDALDLGNSVRIRVKSVDQFEKLLAEAPAETRYSPNYYVLPPEQPVQNPREPESGYLGFGNTSLKWLGASGDNTAWGKGVTIAVLDTKIYQHSALEKNNIKYINLVDQEFEINDDYSGHGTAVASLIAGSSDKLTGIAPSSDLLSIKVLSEEGVGDSFTLAKGIITAVNNNAEVINICIGTYGDSFILQDAVNYALKNNVVIVAATGNDAVEGVTYPAKYEGVVAVSAVDANGNHLYFANSGQEVDIAAPGIGVTAAWTDNSFIDFSGTSASAPFVSGTVAMLLSENPNMTPPEASEIILSYANDSGLPGRDNDLGNGIIDISRIMERDKKGIHDAAIGMPITQRNDNNLSLLAHFQNRGTEKIKKATLSVSINGSVSSFSLYNIQVGQTVSRSFAVSDSLFKDTDGARVISRVTIDTATDAYPENNSKKTVLLKIK